MVLAGVLGVLAIVLVYAFLVSGQGARLLHARRDRQVRMHLHRLRHALAMFMADTGVYPGTLQDLMAPDEHALSSRVPTGTYQGPYLIPTPDGIAGTGLPKNPRCHPQDATVSDHWEYDRNSGAVRDPFRVQDPGYDPRRDL
ncbi:MAG TPA: hypothetical protein VGM23_12485 [Armatimonadota bacterium]